MHTDRWDIRVFLSDDDQHTTAHALLIIDGRERQRGSGTARRNPADRDVPEIGAEIATGRALVELGTKLLRVAEGDIEEITHHPARVHR